MKMSDDTVLMPYELRPGQNITLVSRYDASVDHYGAAPCRSLSPGKPAVNHMQPLAAQA